MSPEEVYKHTGLRMAKEIQEEEDDELRLILENMKQGILLEDTVAALRLEEGMGRSWRKEQGEVFPEVQQPSAKELTIAALMTVIRKCFAKPLMNARGMLSLKQEVEAMAGPCAVTWLGRTIIIRRLQEEADGTHIEINIDC